MNPGDTKMATTQRAKRPQQGPNPASHRETVGLTEPPIAGYSRLWQDYLCAATEINKELMEFITRRWARDAQLGEALAHCEKMEDVLQLQQDWIRQSSEEYADEARRMIVIMSQIGGQHWLPMTEQMVSGRDSKSTNEKH